MTSTEQGVGKRNILYPRGHPLRSACIMSTLQNNRAGSRLKKTSRSVPQKHVAWTSGLYIPEKQTATGHTALWIAALWRTANRIDQVSPCSPSGLLWRTCPDGFLTPVRYSKDSKDTSRKPEAHWSQIWNKIIQGDYLNRIQEIYVVWALTPDTDTQTHTW